MKKWQFLKLLGLCSAIFIIVQCFIWVKFTSLQGLRERSVNAKELVQLILRTWDDKDNPLFLIEPDLLYKILEQQNYSDNEEKCAVFCNIKRKVITFGLFGDSVSMAVVLTKFRQNGFMAMDAKEKNPKYATSEMPPQIITHAFLQHTVHVEPTVHIVAFYNRDDDFLWSSKIQMPTSDLSFGQHAGAYDRFKTEQITIDGIRLDIPQHSRHFLQEVAHSEFHECNYERAALFFKKYEKDSSEPSLNFKRKGRQLLAKAKKVLDDLKITFWISSGTLLGWFRQCDLIPYSQDVDIGIWIKDYKPELVDAFEKAGLPLKHVFGKESDSYELSFQAGNVKLDIFFFYEDTHSMWNGGTDAKNGDKFKYTFAKFKLCWTTLLDLRMRVPCPTQPYIESNYGKDWFIPVKTWNWKKSPPNVLPNGQWPKSEWDKVIQVFEYN